MLIALQEGSKAARCRFSCRWKAAGVSGGGTAGGAAMVKWGSAAGRVVRCWLATGRAARGRLGYYRQEQ